MAVNKLLCLNFCFKFNQQKKNQQLTEFSEIIFLLCGYSKKKMKKIVLI